MVRSHGLKRDGYKAEKSEEQSRKAALYKKTPQIWRSYAFLYERNTEKGDFPKKDREMVRRTKMWYVIQTMTGREEELAEALEKILPSGVYEKSILLKKESVWRLHGEQKLRIDILFPGYVFVETEKPDELYYELKRVPKVSKLLGDGEEEFLPVQEEEKEFLVSLLEKETLKEKDGEKTEGMPLRSKKTEERIVRRSEVKLDEKGEIIEAGEPLNKYLENIIKKRIRKRYVIIEKELFGKKRTVHMGIRLYGEE